jgi:hypothetical protein
MAITGSDGQLGHAKAIPEWLIHRKARLRIR